MNTLPLRTFVRNAAAVFSGCFGAVSRQAQEARCSRQTVYQHARRIEQQLDPATRQARIDSIAAEDLSRRQQLARARQPAEHTVLCDAARLRQVATVAFAAGVSLRQIETLFTALLPAGQAPDHSTIGRWVADEAKKAQGVLHSLDAVCVPSVTTLAADEVFFGGDRLWWGSSHRP